MPHKDASFLRTFSAVLGGLVVFAILLVVFAARFGERVTPEQSEARVQAVQERIRPVGAVYSGEADAERLAAPTEPEEAEPAGEPMSGEQVYKNVCAVCHDIGAGGAPRLTQEAWAARIEQGRDTLYQHSIEGYQGEAGFMPAKGGRPDLSDEEVQGAVDYMLVQVDGE